MEKTPKMHSAYRKEIMELLGEYVLLPNRADLMVASYPSLESEKRFILTIRKLKQLNYLKRVRIGDDSERTERNVIMLTKEGYDILRTNNIPINKQGMERVWHGDGKDRQRKLAEVAIYMKGAVDEELSDYFYLRYIDRDKLMEEVRKTLPRDKRQVYAARIQGVLESRYCIIPIYYVGIHNIYVSPTNEDILKDIICENRNKPKDIDKKILYAKNIKVLSKLFIENTENKKVKEVLQEEKSLFNARKIEQGKRAYLLFSSVEQMKLVEFFRYEDADKAINEYLREQYEGEIIKSIYPSKSAYEVREKIVINMVQQEMYKIAWLKLFLSTIEDGIYEETRKFELCGLKENKIIYEELFSKYDKVTFKELDYGEVLDYVITNG